MTDVLVDTDWQRAEALRGRLVEAIERLHRVRDLRPLTDAEHGELGLLHMLERATYELVQECLIDLR